MPFMVKLSALRENGKARQNTKETGTSRKPSAQFALAIKIPDNSGKAKQPTGH